MTTDTDQAFNDQIRTALGRGRRITGATPEPRERSGGERWFRKALGYPIPEPTPEPSTTPSDGDTTDA